MLRWRRPPAAWASRAKRALTSVLSPASAGIVLRATVRCRTGSSASYTVPIPPRPMRLRILYLPMRSTGARAHCNLVLSSGGGRFGGRSAREARSGRRPGRRSRGAEPRGAGPRSLGRTARRQAHGRRGGGAAPHRRRRPGPRPRARRRGQGGGEQGARHGLEPRGALAGRRRASWPPAGGGPSRRGGGAGAGPRLERTHLGPAGASRRAGDRGSAPALMRWIPEEPWLRNQYVMVATVFVVYTGFAFVLPFLPLYVRKLGVQGDEASALWAGVLVGVAPLIAGLMAPVWGRLADRHGQKRMALPALISYVI